MATSGAGRRVPGGTGALRDRWLVGGLSSRRQVTALAVTVVGLPLLTAALVAARGSLALDSVLLIYLLAVVVVAVIGGMPPALLGAVASFLLANWFLTPPYYTFAVEGRDRFIELLVFVVVAAVVSVTVDIGARNAARGERHRIEARLLSRFASSEIGATTPEGVLHQIRELFELGRVELLDPNGPGSTVLAIAGTEQTQEEALTVRTDGGLLVQGYGPRRFAEDGRLLRALAETAARSWGEHQLAEEASRAEQLAQTDRLRAALLAAVGHDLRTPLAGIKAAVSTLRQDDVEWAPGDQQALLADIETATDQLTDIISNLLAMSRIQAGPVSAQLESVALEEVIGAVLREGHGSHVQLAIPEGLPPVLTDPGLLHRILANLLDNATRYSPPGQPVLLRAHHVHGVVALDVADHGPGVPEADRDRIFMPFQRLDDRHARGGIGLGLAIARGFSQAIGATLTPHPTPGGGLTMRIELPPAT